jgi:hypothetical protein
MNPLPRPAEAPNTSEWVACTPACFAQARRGLFVQCCDDHADREKQLTRNN